MADYITTAEANTYLGISWEDNLIELLNWMVTSKINNYLDVTTLYDGTYTDEEYDLNDKNIYYLKEINPTSITEINWNTPWTHRLDGRRLELLEYPDDTETDFYKVKITYNAGYTEIPWDVKSVAFSLLWLFYNSRKSSWINEFKQWQISVKYWGVTDYEEIEKQILSWLNYYKKNDIYS